MATPKKKVNKTLFNYCMFVDPTNTKSFVGYVGELAGKSRWDSITLTFADCSRKVDLEIYGTLAGLKKVRDIRRTLEKLEEELAEHLNQPPEEEE